MSNAALTIYRHICQYNYGVMGNDSSPYAAIDFTSALRRCILLSSLIWESNIGLILLIADQIFADTFLGAFMLGDLLIGFQDIAISPPQDSFYITFLKHCGIGESFGTTTCHITVVGGKQRHAAYEILLPQRIIFFCQSDFMEIIIVSQSLCKCGHSLSGGYYQT